MSHGLKSTFKRLIMNDALLFATLVAIYITGAEHNLEDVQQDAADEFCNLIEFNSNEFAKLGLELQK